MTPVKENYPKYEKYNRAYLQPIKNKENDITGYLVTSIDEKVFQLTEDEVKKENTLFSNDKHNGPYYFPVGKVKKGQTLNLAS